MVGLYGPWALVAGASQGLGAAFAQALAREGFDLVLVARGEAALRDLADHLESSHGISVKCIVADLGAGNSPDLIAEGIANLDPGLVIYNAAFAPIGKFEDLKMDDLITVIDVNVRGPAALIHRLLPRLTQRTTSSADRPPKSRRSGIILMSSLSGGQGTPRLAAYSASKAFNTILAQGLWHELRDRCVDVTACCAGAIRTPGYANTMTPGRSRKEAPGTMDAERVATIALRSLGKTPLSVPGVMNKFARLFMTRLLPGRTAVKLMSASTRDLRQ